MQTDKTKESVVEFDKEMKALGGRKPISEDELADAQGDACAATRSSSSRSARIAGQIADLWARVCR